MILESAGLDGAFVVTPEPIRDDRGAFYRAFCAQTFRRHGLQAEFPQISVSENTRAGTLRGLHLQRPPAAEVKLIRVTAGAIWDVIVDVRLGSATYGRWVAVELSAANRRQLYVPQGFAHGFVTRSDDTSITYHISAAYEPNLQAGIRWNDPDIAIDWPVRDPAVISDRDRNLPLLRDFAPVDTSAW
jgi:dTDP-4-dehydrorhamnose 3,5-epimerase